MRLPSVDTAVSHIRRDAAAGRFAQWGWSTLMDEFTGVASFEEELFNTLHGAAGIPATFPVGNAGVLHVYGYWFSEVPTPFGYKRDRWSDGVLAGAFQLEPDAFHLTADSDSTLLERVTSAALPLLTAPPADAITADIVVDQYRTRVVALAPRLDAASALIYGIGPADDPNQMRLVTTFPVASDPAEVVAECVAERRLRFNAVAL